MHACFKTKAIPPSPPASAVFTHPGADYKTLTVIKTEISYFFCFGTFLVSISLREAIHLRNAVFVLVPIYAALDELHAVLRQGPGFVREDVLHLEASRQAASLQPQPHAPGREPRKTEKSEAF